MNFKIPSGTRICFDDDLKDGTYKWEKDFRNEENKVLLVSRDIYEKITKGLIPDEIKDEILKNQNGGSSI